MFRKNVSRWRARASVVLAFGLVAGTSIVAAVADTPRVARATPPPVCGTSDTPSVVALADPNFYVDFSLTPKLDTNFAGYAIRAGAATESGLTLALSNFTGGSITLGTGQAASVAVPTISPGTTSTHYFAVKAASLTSTAQTHTITLSRAGVSVCERTFTYVAVRDTIKALANKVRSVTQEVPNSPAVIGDLVVVTVLGDTGTLGAGPSYDPGVLSYAPTAYSTFSADGWRLEKTEMTISPDGSASALTYTDKLYLSGASGPDRPYTAKYYFRSIGPASSSTTIQPIQYIASGTQVKHTDLSGFTPGSLPATATQANISIAKSVSTSTFPPVGSSVQGGRVTYTVTATNHGTTSGTLDKIVDTLAAGTSYVAGTAKVGTRTASTQLSGQVLTLFGPFTIAAGGTLSFTYQVDIPSTAGTYTNSAIAQYGNVQIDGSRDITSSSPATADVVVQSAPGAVIAADDATSTNANTAVTVSILSNDTPSSGVTVAITRNPSSGTAVLNVDNTVTYTPNSGFGGSDTFEYSITIGGVTDTAVVTVSVPLARNDSYSIGPSQTLGGTDFPLPYGVGANDECSKAPCTYAASGTTAGLTFSSNGTFTYVAGSSTGTVTFNYTLTDNAGKTATATVTIIVNNFGPDYATIPYNTGTSPTATRVVLSTNDTCFQGNGSVTQCKAAADGAPSNGTATYPNPSSTYVDYLPNRAFWGNDAFTYKKGSDTGGQVYTLTAPPNASAVVGYGQQFTRTVPSTSYITEFGTPGTATATVSCTSCSYRVKTAPTKGVVSIGASTGTYVYTPNASSTGTDSFVIEVTNTRGQKVDATVSLTLGPSAVDDSYSVFAAQQLSFNVSTNDNCPATCTVSVVGTPIAGLTQTSVGGGAFTYTNSTDIGTFSFQYRVSSSVSGADVTSTATVTIVVDGATADTATTEIGTAVTVSVQANDPCGAGNCTVSAVSTPSVGTATFTSSSVTYTPPAGYVGYATLNYTVTKNSRSTSATVTVTVRPSAIDDAYSARLSSTQQFDILDNDLCAACAVTGITQPAGGGTVSIVSGGGALTFVAPASGSGTLTFTYTIEDSTGATDTATVTVTIATAPTVVNDSDSTTNGVSKSIAVKSNDTCAPSATCTVDFGTDPANGAVSISANPSFDFQYTPRAGYTGTDTFTYLNIASNGLSASGTVTVKVLPTVANDSAVAGIGKTITIAVLSNDVCEGCTITSVTQPATGGGTSSVTSGSLSVTYVAPATSGTYTFDYTITETDITPSESRTATVTVQVGDASPDYATTAYQTAVTSEVTLNDTCRTFSTPCTVTAVDASGSPSGDTAIAANSNLSVTYTPATGFVGIATVPYTASNGTVSATSSLRVLVGPTPLTATTNKNTQLTGDVLSGTSCSDCTVSLVSATLDGEISINSNGTYAYDPKLNWMGTEPAVTYKITDSVSGLSQNGTLTISVYSTEPSVTVEKTGTLDKTIVAPTDRSDAGDKISYSYVVTNTGNVALTNVTVVDDKIADDSTIKCPTGSGSNNVIASLAVSASITCGVVYTVTQADVDGGGVTNTATVTGTPASGTLTPATDSYTVSVTRVASMTLDKSTSGVQDTDSVPNGPGDIGDTIPYSYLVTNTGNVTLTNLTVTDNKFADAAIACPLDTNTDNVVATLAPGQAATCTATHTIAQADIDAGGITNTASVSVTPPSGVTAPSAVTDQVTVSITRTPGMTVVKTGNQNDSVVTPTTRTDTGDKITYTYAITNTGNVTLSNVTVTDDKIANDSTNILCPQGSGSDNVIATLSPGGSVTCGASYTVTQSDIDAGSVTNVATVNATPPTGVVQSAVTDSETVTITRAPSTSVAKTGTLVPGGNSRADAGDTVTYSYVVTNTGNVTLTNVTVVDDKIADDSTIKCPTGSGSNNVIATLDPAQSVTCGVSYTVTQSDMNAGSVTNVATVSGSGPDSNSNPSNSTDTATVTLTRVASTTVAKTGALVPGSNSRADAGDTVNYSYVVTNTGNVTLTNVTVTDDKIASAGIACPNDGNTDNIVATLAPAGSVTCTASYSIVQGDVNAGSVTNVATVSGSGPDSNSNPSNSTDTETVTLSRVASMTVVKAGVLDDGQNDIVDAGDSIAYTYVVTNTGNITLTNVTVTDDKIASADITCPNDGNTDNIVATLAPAGSATCTASYSIVQGDVTAGSVTNLATVSATGSGVNPSNATDTETVYFTVFAALTVDKTGALDATVVSPSSRPDAGDTVAYSYVVTNTGTAVLSNVTVVDDKIADDSTIKCPTGSGADNVIASLSPTSSVTCGVDYVLTQSDIDAGSVTNTASVSATPPNGVQAPSAATDSVTVSLTRNGDLAVTLAGTLDNRVVDPSDSSDTGDKIDYLYTLENTGNVTLSSIDVTDLRTSVPSNVKCPVGSGSGNNVASLSPGASVICGVASDLTQADLDAEEVNNTVTAGFTAPGAVGVQTRSASGRTVLVIVPRVPDPSPTNDPAPSDPVVEPGPSAAATDPEPSLPVCVSPVKDAEVAVTALQGAAFSWKPGLVAGATLASWRLVSGTLPQGVVLNAATGELSGEPSVEGVSNFSIEGTSTQCSGVTKSGTVTVKLTVEPSGIVAGILWFDINKNSKREKNEPLLPGATVKLELFSGAVQAASVRAFSDVRSTVTSATGFYRFDTVPLGKHSLTVEVSKASALKGSWEPDGTPDFRVSVEVRDEKEVAVEIAVIGSTRTAGSAVMTPSMRLMPLSPVTCTWAGFDGVTGTADDVAFSTTTAADGTYVFEGIPAGNYTCKTWDKESGTASAPAPVVVKTSFAGFSIAKLKKTVLKVPMKGPLPATGSQSGAPVQWALALLILGGAFVVGSRVRRRGRKGVQG